MNYNVSGLLKDNRPTEKKANDFQDAEIRVYGADILEWIEKPSQDWARYSIRDQDGSSSCVKQAIAKAMETQTKQVMSARYYRFRQNYPDAGMWLYDGGDIVRTIGIETELALPSQKKGEVEMNLDVKIGSPVKVKNRVFVDPKDIDAIARVIKERKHCILTFETNYKEWTAVPQVLTKPIEFGHAVCGVDYVLYKGKKAIIIEESWGVGAPMQGRRIITEDFLKARCTGAMYLIFEAQVPVPKPKVQFTKPLTYGMMKTVDVMNLQDILKYEKFMASDVESTGNFLNMTAYALKKWQISKNILDFQYENNLSKIRFGSKSITIANSIYK